MKKVHPELFNEMKRTSSLIAAGWIVTRTDGVRKGYTTHDQGFLLEGMWFSPTNSFSGSASVSKNNLSVDNMTVLALVGDDVTDADLRGGVYDNAKVQLFWCRPDKPEWGRMDIQGGTIGEIRVRGLQYEADLRSATQKLQQPFGRIYTTECETVLGGDRCGVQMVARDWAPNMTAAARMEGDASVGTIVKPSTYSGLWYECNQGGSRVTTAQPVETWPGGLRNVLEGSNFDKIFLMVAAGVLGLGFSEGGIVNDQPLDIAYGTTGNTEPAWPTEIGGIVADGQVQWRAIPAREMFGEVASVLNRARFENVDLKWVEDRYFQYGLLIWTSGANKDFRVEVRQHRKGVRASFDLLEAMPFEVRQGDTFIVKPGCPRTRTACKAWNNIYNFQGFPDMPTEDKALATPNYSSQGEQNNGGGKK